MPDRDDHEPERTNASMYPSMPLEHIEARTEIAKDKAFAAMKELEGPKPSQEQEAAWRDRLANAPPVTDPRMRRILGLDK